LCMTGRKRGFAWPEGGERARLARKESDITESMFWRRKGGKTKKKNTIKGKGKEGTKELKGEKMSVTYQGEGRKKGKA